MSKEKLIGALNEEVTAKIVKDYSEDKKNTIVRHALSKGNISAAIYEPGALGSVAPAFSIDLKTLPVANQRRSGRCWIFAGLNVLREIIAKKCELKSFELSQNYISLYDKIEKDTIVSFGLLMLELEEGPADVFFKKIIGYISENRSIFGMVFSPNTTGQLRSKLSEIIKGVFMQKQLEKEESSLSEAELDYMCSYRAQGCIAVIADWVTGGFKEPEEQMIGIISKLDKNTEKIF